MHLFLLGLRCREPGSAADQLPSLLITSASSFLGQACSNFVGGRQRASEPGNHSAQRCPWGTETGQPGPENPNSFQMPMSWRQVCRSPAWTTDDCTPTLSLARHSARNELWLMLLQRPQKYCLRKEDSLLFRIKKLVFALSREMGGWVRTLQSEAHVIAGGTQLGPKQLQDFSKPEIRNNPAY